MPNEIKKNFQGSANHLVMTVDGWKELSQLKRGDLLMSKDGYKAIRSIHPHKTKGSIPRMVGSLYEKDL